MRSLRFFTFLSRGIFPSRNLVDRADNSCRSLSFFFMLFLYISSFWNLEICSYLSLLFFSVFFPAIYLVHPSILSYYSFYSMFYSLPLCLFTSFSDLPYCFIFISAVFSFLFSYSSILSASPLCSITAQYVLFLLSFIFLEPSM